LEETCAALGDRCAWASADVRDPASINAAIDSMEAQIGPFTGLVNNAAGNFLVPAEDISPGAWNSVLSIVLTGTFNCTQALGRRWIDRGEGGRVLNIVTTYAWMGSAFVLPSACAKSGVLTMTRSLAVEWAEYGIRLNAIAPGPFPTEGAFSRLMPKHMQEEAKMAVPLRRFGRPEEIGNLATYLMSDMAGYVTGECVTIDGGEWLLSGQEFGRLTKQPREMVKSVLGSMKPKKK
jgi:NAD(P)-dependent dehydrogenase (short-subunit alcohol dehydrogenase family)